MFSRTAACCLLQNRTFQAGSPRGGYEDFYLLGYNAVWSAKVNRRFVGTCGLLVQGRVINQAGNQLETGIILLYFRWRQKNPPKRRYLSTDDTALCPRRCDFSCNDFDVHNYINPERAPGRQDWNPRYFSVLRHGQSHDSWNTYWNRALQPDLRLTRLLWFTYQQTTFISIFLSICRSFKSSRVEISLPKL